MKRFLSVIFTCVLLAMMGVSVVSESEPASESSAETPSAIRIQGGAIPEGFTLVAENDALQLAIDLITANILVRDKLNGGDWYSNPPDLMTNTEISSDMREQLLSQLVVSFIDSTLNEVVVSSYDACVAENTFEVRQVTDGVKITYQFNKDSMQFHIPVQVTLGKDYAEATILYNEIKENGSARIYSIDLLPYFGAGKSEEDGYLFVPDGSGALVHFQDSLRNEKTYRRTVYGENPSVNLLLKSMKQNISVHLPVFGVKKGSHAFLGVIHKGDAYASLYAESNSGKSPYTSVGSAFLYHQKDLTGIRDKQSNQRTVVMLHPKPMTQSPVVRYYALNGENADYSGMARRYQKYLEENIGMKTGAVSWKSANLKFYGKTSKPSSFLGIPYNKAVVATTFSQAEAVIGQLKNAGVDKISAFLYGFEKGGYEKSYAFKPSFDAALGGRRGYEQLSEAMKGSTMYLVADLIRDYRKGLGIFLRNQYTKSLNKVNVVRKEPMISTGDWDNQANAWRYVTAPTLKRNADTFLKGIKKYDKAGVMFHYMGEELYSDLSTAEPTDRQEMQETYRTILDDAANSGVKLAGDGGNAYLLGKTELLSGVPVTNSRHDLFGETVPFYAMVLHGYVELASAPVNTGGDADDFVLTLIESGILPTYSLTGCNSAELAETPLNFLYNTKADNWIERISAVSTRYMNMQRGLENVRIHAHRTENTLSIVSYENGVTLVANHGTAEADYQGQSVAAGELIRIEP